MSLLGYCPLLLPEKYISVPLLRHDVSIRIYLLPIFIFGKCGSAAEPSQRARAANKLHTTRSSVNMAHLFDHTRLIYSTRVLGSCCIPPLALWERCDVVARQLPALNGGTDWLRSARLSRNSPTCTGLVGVPCAACSNELTVW